MDKILSEPHLPQPINPKTIDQYEIVFENVSFSYTGQEAAALSDVSFRAEENQITAIVGPSGGGKVPLHILSLAFLTY